MTGTNNSYQQIVKSSTIIGGSQGIKIAINIVQIKALALLLGPAGIGIISLYQSTMGILGSVFGLGVGSSGVRQVSEAAATDDKIKISLTIGTLRLVSVILGLLGLITVLLSRKYLSQLTFGNADHAAAFAILSVTLFFASIARGQTALIQGMRRIGDLAKLSIIGSFLGLVISVPIVYVWGMAGIAPYFAALSVTAFLSSWWYARKIHVPGAILKIRDILSESKDLVSLGFMLMLSTLMAALILYLIRVVVLRKFGVEAAGLYHAAFQLSNVYIGFILAAMGMDFFPRLTASAKDHDTTNRLVNEQAEIGMLMAAPGLLATLTFAPLVIRIFYSHQFVSAYDILQWQVMGTFLRVASWPLAYVQLAQGAKNLFFLTQLTANAVHLLLIWLAIKHFGLVGTGIAFFCLYAFYLVFIYAVTRRLSGFTWSSANIRLGLMLTPAVAGTFLLTQILSPKPAMIIGSVLTLFMSIYSLKELHKLIGSPTPFMILTWIKQQFSRNKG